MTLMSRIFARIVKHYETLVPLALFFALAAGPICVWWFIGAREDLAIRDLTIQYARNIAIQIQSTVDARIGVLRIIAHQRTTRNSDPDFEIDVERLASDAQANFPGLTLITWIDSNEVLRWVYPRTPITEHLIGRSAKTFPSAAYAEKATETGQPIATPPFDLAVGGRGFTLTFPLLRKGKRYGRTTGVVRIAELMDVALREGGTSDFQVLITSAPAVPPADGRSESEGANPRRPVLYESSWTHSEPAFDATQEVRVLNQTWTVQVEPRSEYVSALKTPAKTLLLMVGLILSAGMALTFRAALRSRRTAMDNHKRFQDVAESSTDWLWELNPDFRLTYISSHAEEMLGSTKDFKLGQSWLDLPGGADNPDSVRSAYRRLMESRLPFRNFEFHERNAEGRLIVARLTGKPLFDALGQFQGYRGTGTDVTGELELQQRLQDAIESLPAGFYMYDSDERLVAWNRYIDAQYPGLHARMRAGMHFLEVVRMIAEDWVPGSLKDKEDWCQTRLAQFRSGSSTSEVRLKDGRTLRGVDWRTASGSTVILRFDITEEKRREEELRRVQTHLFNSIEALSVGFMLWDADERLVLWNSHMQKLYPDIYPKLAPGLSYSEFQRMMIPKVRPEPGLDIEARHKQRLASFRSATGRDELDLADGRTVQLVDWRTADGSTVSLRTDITEDKQREQVYLQSQRMDAFGKLSGGIAHDFNNLLTVILGSIEILMAEMQGRSGAQKLVETIRTAALRGADLTSRLLAYSRKQTLRPQSIDFNRLVVGMGEMLRRVLGEHIQVESVLAGGLWSALADAAQLENAILNLAVNARDAMPAGGKLTLETANIRLDEQYAVDHPDVRPGRYVMLAVSDTGQGMAPEIIKRAFEPFFTTKEPGKGSGLGLSMVYGFVKQSGGHVKIYSEPGRGTAVKIYLPCTDLPGKTEAPKSDHGQALPVGTERILVVEDDDLVRKTVVHQLKGLGYEVLEAGHGAAALDILLGPEPVDLLFTDVIMPGGMMGRELAKRALELRKRIRVLYTSGYTENSIVHRGTLDPEVAILAKPYTRDALARKIRAVLDATG